MSEVYIYRPDCDDFSTIGVCGRLDASLCECEMVANGMIELTLEHPIDRRGRYRLLKEDWILKTEIPVLTTPEIQNGAYVTSVQRWTVSRTATAAQRAVWSRYTGGSKKKTLKAGASVVVVSAPTIGSRYRIKTGKVTGWVESAALVDKVEETIPATADGIERAVPSWELKEQTFRIYNVSQTDKKVTVNARARSYDLAYNLTTYDVNGEVSLQAALDGIFGNTLDGCEAEGYTDIGGTRIGVHARDRNPIEAILDPEDGLCARWNAQLVRDEMDFYLLARAGRDRGVRIEYAKNLSGIHMSTSIDDVFTHVRPIGENRVGNPLYLTTQDGLMACPNAALYPFKRIYPLKVSEAKMDKEVSANLARTRMTEAAQNLIDSGIDQPSVDAKIAFERLGDLPKYAQYKDLRDRAFLYDTITIYHPVLGIDIKAQVCKIKWDCLREKAKDMDIGSLEKLSPSVSSWQLSGGISGSKLAYGTVSGAALAEDVINARHVQAESISADTLQANSVTAEKLAANSVTAGKIAPGSVDTDQLAANAVTADKISAGAVTAGKLAAGLITADSGLIAVGAIGTAQIADGSVTTAKIAAGAVETAKLDDEAVTTAKIADSAVTTAKLDDLAVTAAKIGAGAVETAKIDDEAVTTAKIADGAVTLAKLDAGAIRPGFYSYSTSYSYSAANIATYGAPGYTGSWVCGDTTGVQVGDTVMLRLTNSTSGGDAFIFAQVLQVESATRLRLKSMGALI